MPALRRITCQLAPAILALGAVAGAAEETAAGSDKAKIASLERQLTTLRESYAMARADADAARKQVQEIRARLEALGSGALGEGEERLIEAVSQLEASRRQLQETRQSVLRLTAAMNAYIQSALSEDAEARMQLEAAMRDMEVTLGLRAMPQDELAGTVGDATILSIDSESGLIVINAGRDAKVMVGLAMLITRGTQEIAEAVVTDVRKKVAGLLVRKHLNPALKIDVGDHASVTSTTY